MKHKNRWAGALALAVTLISGLETMAVTNGMILITTRLEHDISWAGVDLNNIMGPGQTSPGDVGMEAILGDYGYSCRFIIDAEMNPTKNNPFTSNAGDPNVYLFPGNTDFTAMLVINSGTSGSANVGPPNTNDIPIIMGEHSCISDQFSTSRHNSLYLYSGPGSNDTKNDEVAEGGTNQYMKVLLPNHPIMQGIPLDAQGMVKIFRDPYPEEGGIPGGVGPVGSHTPPGGKKNYEYAWTTINASQAAAGTQVIGVLGGYPERACFATADVGAQLASTGNDPDHPWQLQFHDNIAHQRLVHWFINDQGSGGSRRCFNSLTDIGRVIFIRTVKWALGETLTPYQPLGLIRVSKVGEHQIRLEWDGTATKNYKILGTQNLFGPPDFSNWQTVAQDIPGVNGPVSATFDVSRAVQYAFLRVMPVP